MDRVRRAEMEGVLHRLVVQGVGQRDPVAYFDRTYHPDVVIHEAPQLPYGGDYSGHKGAVEHARRFVATWAAFQAPEHYDLRPTFVVDQDHAVSFYELRAADGDIIHTVKSVGHYRFVDGLIVESRMYHFDLPALLDLLGCGSGGHEESSSEAESAGLATEDPYGPGAGQSRSPTRRTPGT